MTTNNSKSFCFVQDNINTASKFAIEHILSAFDKLCLFHICLENRFSYELVPASNTLKLSRKWDEDDTLDLQVSEIFKEKRKIIVFIDSLNQMILLFGWKKCFNCVQKMLKKINIHAVVGVFHKDTNLNGTKTFDSFKHIATTYIEVSHHSTLHTTVTCVFNKSKQKGLSIPKQVSYYNEMGLERNKCLKGQNSNSIESALNSTFKISLREEEKLIKDTIQLPYEFNSKENESKVLYEQDSGDDWDDEDPDDDLLI